MDGNKKLIRLIKEFQLGNEALNQGLRTSVLEEMRSKKVANEQRSNIGGWQSDRDLHTKSGSDTPFHKLLAELFASFSAPIVEYINACCTELHLPTNKNYDWNYTGAWFNVSSTGGYNAPHTHPLNIISAVYYVYAEPPPEDHPFSGRIDFYSEAGDTYFTPKPGNLILFPSDMLHFAHPYYGTGERISMSFNIDKIRVL
jgi:hypothetical protein